MAAAGNYIHPNCGMASGRAKQGKERGREREEEGWAVVVVGERCDLSLKAEIFKRANSSRLRMDRIVLFFPPAGWQIYRQTGKRKKEGALIRRELGRAGRQGRCSRTAGAIKRACGHK